MGRAILDGWLHAGEIGAGSVTVVDPVATGLPGGIRLLREAPSDERFDTVVLAVKPQLIEALATGLAPVFGTGTLLLSILAGVEHAKLERLFPGATVVRFMANLAATLGLSPVAVYAGRAGLTAPDHARVDRMLAALGEPKWLEDEQQLHAVTALGGSGPGFVYRFLAALARAGEDLGLEPGQATSMALATVRGAVELAARSGEDFGALAARVASPGGTTEAGLAVLERGRALDSLLAATLRAAHDRSEELASR
jgi:pyrroline-5-carboxylate reductase